MKVGTTLVLALLMAAPLQPQRRILGKPWATRSMAVGRNMAATSHGIATRVALDTMLRGGTAVDAAIAANAILCLAEPTGCGLGGDLFAIVWDARTGKLHGLNGSGRSPASLTLAQLKERLAALGQERIPALGALPVSVPGCVDGWFALHDRFGKLAMADVLQPAIAYARDGIPIPEIIAEYWRRNARTLRRFPNFAETFLPDGRAPQTGDLFANPDLARTLERIAAAGREAFYAGEVARTIAEAVREQGGYLSVDDLAAHRSEWVEPVSTDYRGHRVWELPPNGQGIAALQMLNILEAHDLRAAGFGSAEHLHLLCEAKKVVYEDRARWYGDMAFSEIPVAQLISKKYAAKRRALIDPEKAAASYPAGNPALESGDTVYLTTADAAGNMVSLIQSNFRGMGSGICPPGLGFVLQDRGELFDLREGRPNTYAPAKRPFHTIIPAFVTRDGEPYLSFGVMGGAMQPQGHVQILLNLIDFGMNLQEAGDAPRLRHEDSSQPTGTAMIDGGKLFLEPGFATDVVAGLRGRGHRITVRADSGYGGYQAILRRPDGLYLGASESRKDGHAAGY